MYKLIKCNNTWFSHYLQHFKFVNCDCIVCLYSYLRRRAMAEHERRERRIQEDVDRRRQKSENLLYSVFIIFLGDAPH